MASTDRERDEEIWDNMPQMAKPVYKIDERPAGLLESFLYGWQHTLVDISPFVLPLAVAGAIGMGAGARAEFINFCLFSMGIATLLQTTIGNRLPIIQGPSATLTGTLAPIASQLGGAVMWGAAFVGGLIEMIVGASGMLKHMKKLFPPVVSGVVIVSIGLSLGELAVRLTVGDGAPINFFFAVLTLLFIFVLQLRLKNVAGGIVSRGAIFISIWLIGLGVGSAFGEVDWALVASKPWFQLPSIFPYGGPGFGWEFAAAAIIAACVGYFGSMVESLGDYAATCAVSDEPYKAQHMNRGIFSEGLGSAIAAVFGGLPCTSYTQNIGIIAATRVASRYVVQIAAVILILYGLCPKFGALLVAMPRAVLGGVFILVCGMIVVAGMQLLSKQLSDPPSTVMVGITLVCALGLPVIGKYGLGTDWLDTLPVLLRLLLTNSVVIAVLLSVTLLQLLRFISNDLDEN